MPQIIWAPNGVGKTSIYRALQNMGFTDIAFHQFNENRDSYIKGLKKELRIGLHIKEIANLQSERADVIASVENIGGLKHFGATTIAALEEITPTYGQYKTNYEKLIGYADESAALRLAELIPENDAAFFLRHWTELGRLSQTKKEIDNQRTRVIHQAMQSIEKWLDEDEYDCPICGNHQDIPILDTIRKRRAELSIKKAELVESYALENPQFSKQEISNRISALAKTAQDKASVTEEGILGFCLARGNESNAKALTEAKSRLDKIDTRLEELTAIRDRFFDQLKPHQSDIQEMFILKLKANRVTFDDDEKEIVITLPRKASEYSTGEINLMVTLTKLYEFRGGDSTVLVLDDPITSFDTANQYVIIFNLVDIISNAEEQKSIVIFTHNTDCINIAESQYPGLFVYLGLERWSDEICLHQIDLSKDGKYRFVCQEAITACITAKEDPVYNEKLAYIRALEEREEGSSHCNDLHKLFHYDGPSGDISFGNMLLNNKYLVQLIDDFSDATLNKESFAKRCIDKALVLLASRVWIEKQLHDCLKNDAGYARCAGKPLAVKIDYIFPAKGDQKWKGSSKVNRSYLMSKKVMLNQASHVHAQPIPFEYALNLSAYDIVKTITDIKEHFI